MSAKSPGEVAFLLSNWPLVLEHFPARPQSDADMEQLLRDSSSALTRREVFVMLSDTRQMTGIWDAKNRRLIADWLKANSEATKTYAAGNVVLLNSELVRGALTAVLWLVPTPYPIKVVTTVDAAVDGALSLLSDRGIDLPVPRDELATRVTAQLENLSRRGDA